MGPVVEPDQMFECKCCGRRNNMGGYACPCRDRVVDVPDPTPDVSPSGSIDAWIRHRHDVEVPPPVGSCHLRIVGAGLAERFGLGMMDATYWGATVSWDGVERLKRLGYQIESET